MEKKPTNFSKIFGIGPVGLLISLVLLFIAIWVNKQIDLPPLSNNQSLLNSVFFVSCLMTLAIIVWSFKSLPAAERGNKLCTTGAFKYVRHPLYAAFLSVFDFGLAIYLNSYIGGTAERRGRYGMIRPRDSAITQRNTSSLFSAGQKPPGHGSFPE